MLILPPCSSRNAHKFSQSLKNSKDRLHWQLHEHIKLMQTSGRQWLQIFAVAAQMEAKF